MSFLRIISLLVFAGVSALWADSESTVSLGRAPRPEDGIHDPAGRLSVPAKVALVREMKSIRDSSGLDVLVAVVGDPGEWEPQQVADDLAKRWGYHGGRALVLWIPGRTDNPWISISGMIRSELPAATYESTVNRARERARADPRMEESIRKAVASLGEDLRFVGAKSARKLDEAAKSPELRTRDAILVLMMRSKKLFIAGGAAVLIAVVVCLWLYRKWRDVRMALTPKTFPEVSWKRRFGAPHAGIVYTTSKKNKPTNP